MVDQDELNETIKKKHITNKVIATSLIAFVLIGAIFGIAIPNHYKLEQNKLDLMRHQFDVEADQTNHSQELQAAQERVKALEIVMNSPVVEATATNLLEAPKIAGNAAADLAVKLIERLNINVDLNAQIGSNKDETDAKTAQNEFNGIPNTPMSTLGIVNNNTSGST